MNPYLLVLHFTCVLSGGDRGRLVHFNGTFSIFQHLFRFSSIGRVKKSNAREMQSFLSALLQKVYLSIAKCSADRALLKNTYQTAIVLFDVLKAVNQSQFVEVDRKVPIGDVPC